MAKKQRKKQPRIRIEEPECDNWDKLDEEERVKAVRHWPELYREFHGNTKLRNFYYKWVSKHYDNENIAAAKAGSQLVTHLHGSYARMIQQNYGTEYYRKALVKQTDLIIEYGKKKLAEKGAVVAGPEKYRPTIQEAIREKTGWVIGEIEFAIDTFIENGCKKSDYNLYKFIEGKALKVPHTALVQKYLESHLDELDILIGGKDDQLNEGYAFLKKGQIKKYHAFVARLLKECKQWAVVVKGNRKSRTRKVKTAKQQVAGVKYLDEFKELDLTSVSPTKLIDATQVWLYHTPTRFLYRYDCKAGVVIKGSTIKGYDATSTRKKLRKPEKILPDVIGGGKVKLRKLMDSIRAKDGKVTGRINKDMIIVRIVS